MSIVVTKYGGTSIGTLDKITRISDYIALKIRRTAKRYVIVVSAMSGETSNLERSATILGAQKFAKEKDNLLITGCLLYTSPSPRDRQKSRMPSSA